MAFSVVTADSVEVFEAPDYAWEIKESGVLLVSKYVDGIAAGGAVYAKGYWNMVRADV